MKNCTFLDVNIFLNRVTAFLSHIQRDYLPKAYSFGNNCYFFFKVLMTAFYTAIHNSLQIHQLRKFVDSRTQIYMSLK